MLTAERAGAALPHRRRAARGRRVPVAGIIQVSRWAGHTSL